MAIRAMASIPRSARNFPAIAPQLASVRRPAALTCSRIASPITTNRSRDPWRPLIPPLPACRHTNNSNDLHQISPPIILYPEQQAVPARDRLQNPGVAGRPIPVMRGPGSRHERLHNRAFPTLLCLTSALHRQNRTWCIARTPTAPGRTRPRHPPGSVSELCGQAALLPPRVPVGSGG